ncbi:Uncharacterised protein [Mycobacterium tuberculosis]|nr:Uncharacterised protein [Mycobacterium tuberculosis]CKP60015.1 Uncharacterised protein [Mycobacterium tuberculosis]CKS04898.1 Uncharacterised protein [Mycobacterium tuberculosis]CKS09823.1 Uncharacterised protein [Mycobacterium tuberculosis]CKV00971.1 Uncharacterised protein [Mycobacterium tuberculosis]
MGPIVTPPPTVRGMRSIVIGGGLNPSIWPSISIDNGNGCAGTLNPGMVKPGLLIDTLTSNPKGLSGALMPFGNSVIGGVSHLIVKSICGLVGPGMVVSITIGPIKLTS